MRILSVAIASGIAGLGLLVGSNNAQAANLVTNGSFENTTGTVPGQLNSNPQITGWTLPTTGGNSYDFIYSPGTGTTASAVKFYGPMPATSPDGGNYIAIDTAYPSIATSGDPGLRQTVSGLTPGQQYAVSFYDAAAQQQGYSGNTTDQFQVTFGTQTLNASYFSLPSQTFSGWRYESLRFTASSASQALNFLGVGGPSGVPPFILLDGVSVAPVPEPSFVWSLGAVMAFGLGAGLKAKLTTKK